MKKIAVLLCVGLYLIACSSPVNSPELADHYPDIYPDYTEVTIPAGIAPMNFYYQGGEHERIDVRVMGGKSGELHINAKEVSFPRKKWQKLLEENTGDKLQFTVSVRQAGKWKQFRPFLIHISPDTMAYGLVYRKISPGYEVYGKMGIYERDLSTFTERPLLENTLVPGMCVNCHSFNKTDPGHISLHIRGKQGATLMQIDGRLTALNTKTDSTLSTFTYPYWHPSGEYIAYSVNLTRQSFHSMDDKRVEVLDLASDIVVYHPETQEVLRSPLLQEKDIFETFPAFSPDGRTLYFCSADTKPIPDEYNEIRYNLCSIGFNPETGTFGNGVDTLVNAAADRKSISFPRPSYDGKYLMYTLSDYGNFSIWHKEADLWLLDLENGTNRPITEVNSGDTDSFHNWTANCRWFVFSSRRGDGLYTRLYLAHIDEDGQVSKPFLLPQKNPEEYYNESTFSYNVPEFTSEPVPFDHRMAERRIVSPKREQVQIRDK